MMTSSQIRQSFLDFFKSKQHTIVPSSSLMPDSPNLLFTNAGMNQFVPIFLGQTQCPYLPGRAADTQKCIRAGGKHNDLDDVGLDTYHHTFFEMLGNWSFGNYFKKEAIEWAWELVVTVWKFPPQRLYATVFCPYHGEAGWEARWQTELEQVLAMAMVSSTYIPPNASASPFEIADQEAALYWAKKFTAAGYDPRVHIVPGNKKDNFWMMGETGPCGPCTEIHVDLTPAGNTRGRLVNQGDARCIEIWNNVFIQFNANPDGTFVPLPAKHVDTGMGFERVTSIIQGTKGLKNFKDAKISNYETDIFRPIFDVLEKMSGKTYRSTLPGQADVSALATDVSAPGADVSETAAYVSAKAAYGVVATREAVGGAGEAVGGLRQGVGRAGEPIGAPRSPVGAWPGAVGDAMESVGDTSAAVGVSAAEQIAIDIAFRVIADHIRTLSFAIADGIQPGNTDRNYVLRRILRRAVRYGRTLGFKEPFFYKLVDVLAVTMGDVFPEIRTRKQHVQDTIRIEEEAFNKTLDRGIERFDAAFFDLVHEAFRSRQSESEVPGAFHLIYKDLKSIETTKGEATKDVIDLSRDFWPKLKQFGITGLTFPSRIAFELYDTYGFPLDLTELMARERGLTVDKEGFEKLMEEQRNRARSAQKKEVIALSQVETTAATQFVGYDHLEVDAKVLEVVSLKDKTAVILDRSTCYAEMGGQVGDTGLIDTGVFSFGVTNTQKSGNTFLHLLDFCDDEPELPKVGAVITVRTDQNRRKAIQRHHTVTHLLHWALHEVANKEASQKGSFVGPDKLTFDFNSAPLTPAQVADIEKLVNERILENAGVSWTEVLHNDVKGRKDVMQFFGDKYGDTVRVVQIGGEANQLNGYSMELCGGTHTRATGEIGLFRIVSEAAVAAGVRRIEAVAGLAAYDLANQQLQLIRSVAGKLNAPVGELEKKIEAMLAQQKDLEKLVKAAQQREASNAASELLSRVQAINGIPAIIHNVGGVDGDFLQAVVDSLKGRFLGVIVLGGAANEAVALVASVSADFTAKLQAGKIIQAIAPIVGGKGGGKPDNARGGGKDATKLDEALAKAKSLLG